MFGKSDDNYSVNITVSKNFNTHGFRQKIEKL